MKGDGVSIVTASVVLHDREKAVEVGQSVLRSQLAAGYNLFPVESAFWWKGEILQGDEFMVLFKTTARLVDALVGRVVEMTGAEVPDVFVSESSHVDERYRAWVEAGAKG